MPTLAQAFEQFRNNLSLDDGQKQQILERRSKLIDLLQDRFRSPVRPIGSHARGTNIPPIGDIDLMLVLQRSRSDDPVMLLDEIRDVLAEKYSGVRRQNRSVGILYGDFRFDVVPAIVRSRGGYHLPDAGSQKWIFTYPEKHNDHAKKVDQGTGAMAIPMVRMLKSWNRRQLAGLKSFHLEVMVLRALGTKPASYAEGTRDALRSVARAVRSSCGDPAESGNTLDTYLSTLQRDQIARRCQEASDQLSRAIELDQQGKPGEAIRLAREVFGAPFPG
jgi:hypothetical protein